MRKDNLQRQSVVFKCKQCGKMIEHFTRKPMLMTKTYCDDCVYQRKRKYYASVR